jgi:hypothetical protein
MNFDNYTPTKQCGLKAMSYNRMHTDYKESKNKEDIIEAKPVFTNSIMDINLLSLVPKNGNDDEDDIIEMPKSILKKPKNDIITQFYIGSLSVVGLYILFRFLYVKK